MLKKMLPRDSEDGSTEDSEKMKCSMCVSRDKLKKDVCSLEASIVVFFGGGAIFNCCRNFMLPKNYLLKCRY